jgi:hypothetical protein
MRECESCTWGEYAPKKAQPKCEQCYSDFGVPYSSYPGSSNCTRCVVGYYWDGVQCLECRKGVVCETAGQTLEGLILQTGYFRFESSSKSIYPCPHDNCIGGNTSVDHSHLQGLSHLAGNDMYRKRSKAIRDANDLCRRGSQGPLCAICEDDFTLNRETNQCESCATAINPVDYVFGSFMITWMFLSFARAASGSAKYRKGASKLTAVLQMTHLTLDQVLIMGMTIQTILLFVENYRLAGGEPLPFSYTEFLRFFGVFTLDLEYIFPVGCIDGFKYWIELVAQSILLVVVGIVTTGSYLRARRREGPKAADHLERFVVFSKFALPGVVRTAGKAFTCRTFENDDHKSYLLVNYEMDCRSFDYALVRPYAAVVIVLYGIAAPVVVWSLLARFRLPIENAISAGTLGLESTKGAGANKKPRILLEKEMLAALHRGIKASSVLKGTALKCLFRYTKPECWWFEVADIARRLCITSVSLLFEGSQKLLFFGILVTSFCLVVHREVQPYLEPSLNVIKYFEHWLTMLCLVVLLGKDADMFGAYPRIPYAFGASVLYVTHLAMGAFMIRSIFNRAIQERLDHTAMVQQEINERFTLEGSSSTDRRTTQARVIDVERHNARVRDRASRSPKKKGGTTGNGAEASRSTSGERKARSTSAGRSRSRRARSPRNRRGREARTNDVDDADDSYFQGTNPLHDDSDWRDITTG